MDDADRYRCRRIYLKQSDRPAFQVEAACEALNNIDGILLAGPFDTYCIHITQHNILFPRRQCT